MSHSRVWKCAAAMLIGCASVSATGESALQFLECDLEATSIVIGFAENPPRVIDALNQAVELKDVQITDAQIQFLSDNPFHSHWLYAQWVPDAPVNDAYSMTVSVNRLTGRADVSFFKEYGPREIAQCRAAGDGPWCDYAPLTATKSGPCKPVVRRF